MNIESVQELIKDVPGHFDLHYTNGEILLLDGDIPVYECAHITNVLATAVRKFYTLVMSQMFVVGINKCYVFLTPDGCAKCNRYFYPSVSTYQDNREGKSDLPVRASLKQYLIDNPDEYASSGIKIISDAWFEADDLIIMHAENNPDKSIVMSKDKDLRLTRAPWWDIGLGKLNIIDNRFGSLYWNDSVSSYAACKGRGTKFFLAQMLMGDPADNVRGLTELNGKKCGSHAAYKFLNDITDESEAATAVCRAYKEINQNILAEAELLWLRRFREDSAFTYFKEVIHDDELINWLGKLHSENMAALAEALGE